MSLASFFFLFFPPKVCNCCICAYFPKFLWSLYLPNIHAGNILFRTSLLHSRNSNEIQRPCVCDSIQSPEHGYCCCHELLHPAWANVSWKVIHHVTSFTNYHSCLHALCVNFFHKMILQTSMIWSFYRLLGAAVIIAGLYLVVWGKARDYESPEKTIGDELTATKQAQDEKALETITIAPSCKWNARRWKRTNDKRNPISISFSHEYSLNKFHRATWSLRFLLVTSV